MTEEACYFVSMYKTSIDTKYENRDHLGPSEMGLADYLLTHPCIVSAPNFRQMDGLVENLAFLCPFHQ